MVRNLSLLSKTPHCTLSTQHSRCGYTLIELVVVIGLSSMLLITAVSIFFTTLQGGGKTASAEYAKQSGQYAMNQITYMIRNARGLTANASGEICDSSMDSIGIINQDGTTTIVSYTQSKLSVGTSKFLVPDDVIVRTTAGPLFNCKPSSYGTSTWDGSPPSVTIQFSVGKGTQGVDRDRDIVEIPFQSSISLRNY